MSTRTAEQSVDLPASLVGEVTVPAEHALLHGPAPDCAVEMDALLKKHRIRIEAARQVEAQSRRELNAADRPNRRLAIRNVAATAIAESDAVIESGHVHGAAAVERMLPRFTALFEEIGRGRGLGHRRTDLGVPASIPFRNLRPLPFMVVYDQQTNIVLGIIGARGLHEDAILADDDRA